MKTESRIQSECVQWFRNNYCLKHHNPSCIMFSVSNEGKNAAEQMRKVSMGMMAGVSDTIIVFPNHVIFCEFKDDKGRQSDKQKEFEQRINALGFDYWLIRNFEEFKQKILSIKY